MPRLRSQTGFTRILPPELVERCLESLPFEEVHTTVKQVSYNGSVIGAAIKIKIVLTQREPCRGIGKTGAKPVHSLRPLRAKSRNGQVTNRTEVSQVVTTRQF